MGELKWENLKEKKCPKCGSAMIKTGSGLSCMGGRARGHCRFKVSNQRIRNLMKYWQKIEEQPKRSLIKVKWQLLKRRKCPICGRELKKKEGEGVYTCETPECDFLIHEGKWEIILNDPTHACNYYDGKPWEDDVSINVKILKNNPYLKY